MVCLYILAFAVSLLRCQDPLFRHGGTDEREAHCDDLQHGAATGGNRIGEIVHFGPWRSCFCTNKKLLAPPGLTTRSKDATNGAPGIATNGAFLLLETRSYVWRSNFRVAWIPFFFDAQWGHFWGHKKFTRYF